MTQTPMNRRRLLRITALVLASASVFAGSLGIAQAQSEVAP